MLLSTTHDAAWGACKMQLLHCSSMQGRRVHQVDDLASEPGAASCRHQSDKLLS